MQQLLAKLDAIHGVQPLDRHVMDVPEHELDDVLGASYDSFAGRQVQEAIRRFSPTRPLGGRPVAFIPRCPPTPAPS